MMKTRAFSINRAVACMIAFLMLVLSLNFSSDVNASNTSRTYKRYNAKTGAYLGSYTLDKLSTRDNASTRDVIGSDDRVIDFTKSGVVKMIVDSDVVCTGFVVDSHTIATAGHCVSDYIINSIKLFDSDGNNVKDATPVEYHIPANYSRNTSRDYALITVSDDLSDYAIFDLGVVLDDAISQEKSISITGFPKSKNSLTYHAMYTGNGVLKDSNSVDSSSKLYYTCYTSTGNSGSPIYATMSYDGKVYYTVIGIHTSGSYEFNSGVRITTDLLHFYIFNKNKNF